MPGKWLKLGLNLSELYIYLKKIETRTFCSLKEIRKACFLNLFLYILMIPKPDWQLSKFKLLNPKIFR